MTLSITLQKDDERFLEQAVKSGRYVCEEEILAIALAEWRQKEESRELKLTKLREEIQVGLEQLVQGDVVEWSAEDVKRRGRERMA